MNLRLNRRKKKRIVNWRYKRLQKLRYFEDCNFEPCEVTLLYRGESFYESFVDGNSLVTSNMTSCSLLNCNAWPLTQKEAFERRDYWNSYGKEAYLKKYVYITEN